MLYIVPFNLAGSRQVRENTIGQCYTSKAPRDVRQYEFLYGLLVFKTATDITHRGAATEKRPAQLQLELEPRESKHPTLGDTFDASRFFCQCAASHPPTLASESPHARKEQALALHDLKLVLLSTSTHHLCLVLE
jgi:hypothetical protein